MKRHTGRERDRHQKTCVLTSMPFSSATSYDNVLYHVHKFLSLFLVVSNHLHLSMFCLSPFLYSLCPSLSLSFSLCTSPPSRCNFMFSMNTVTSCSRGFTYTHIRAHTHAHAHAHTQTQTQVHCVLCRCSRAKCSCCCRCSRFRCLGVAVSLSSRLSFYVSRFPISRLDTCVYHQDLHHSLCVRPCQVMSCGPLHNVVHVSLLLRG